MLQDWGLRIEHIHNVVFLNQVIMKTQPFALKLLNLALFFALPSIIFSQPAIEWQKSYGGSALDMAYQVIGTSDGGYVMIGESKSSDGMVLGNQLPFKKYSHDIWVVKTDINGTIEWQKSYGGSSFDIGAAIVQDADGGYVFTGTTMSTDGDVVGSNATADLSSDIWVVKINATGDIQWQKCVGGTSSETGRALIKTKDGGYLLGGSMGSDNAAVTGWHGANDIWLAKLDGVGNIQWQKCYGGTNQDGIFGFAFVGQNYPRISLVEASTGGYFFCSNSMSTDGDVTGHHGPGGLVTINGSSHWDADVWAVKIDNFGGIEWQKSLGGTDEDWGYGAVEASDGGFVLVGSTKSSDGDVSGNLGTGFHGWTVKLDAAGSMIWQDLKGIAGQQGWLYSITKSLDGSYFCTGKTGNDVLLSKIDANGKTSWQKKIVGNALDAGTSGFQTADGGYVFAGWSASSNGEITGNMGNYDYILIKLSSVPNYTISGNVYEDLNSNCVKDSGEVGLPGKFVKASPGNYFATTDMNGDYTLFVDSGNYVISQNASAFYQQSCPLAVTYNVTISSTTPNSIGNDFADTLTSHCSDLKHSISTPRLRRCFKNTYAISYHNNGAVDATNTSISVTFPAEVIPLYSSIPWNFDGGLYKFNVGSIGSNQGGIITIVDSVSCKAVLGSVVQTQTLIETTSEECNLNNNADNFYISITGSCDPNSIQVASQAAEGGYLNEEDILNSDTLSYLIKFQNIGNDTAFTVVVRDTLSNYLNPESIELINASHPYTFRMYGQGICEWTFNNVNLTDTVTNELGSHGFISFKIAQYAGNKMGDVIENSAGIWFDYNESINTNSTHNTIVEALIVQEEENIISTVTVYPNPMNSYAVFYNSITFNNAAIVISNLLGEEVKRVSNVYGLSKEINVTDLREGFYLFIIIENGQTKANGKLLIE